MGYLASKRGDYLTSRQMAAARGGFLGSLLGGVVKFATGGIKAFTQRAVPLAGAAGVAAGVAGQLMPGGIPLPGGRALHPTRILPGGKPFITGPGKRRRMNVANPKALKRAIRREQGFIKLARRTLKGTGYSISRRGFAQKRRARR